MVVLGEAKGVLNHAVAASRAVPHARLPELDAIALEPGAHVGVHA